MGSETEGGWDPPAADRDTYSRVRKGGCAHTRLEVRWRVATIGGRAYGRERTSVIWFTHSRR